MKLYLSALLLCCQAGFATAAIATEPNTPFYIGLALGGSDYDDGGSFDQLDVDEEGGAIRFYGGYHINPYLSVEAAFTLLGEHEARNTKVDIDSSFSTVMFSLLAQYPTESGLAVYGQLGAGFMSVYQEYHYISPDNTLIDDDESESDTAFLTGAGISYTAPSLSTVNFRLGWERYYHSVDIVTAKGGYIGSEDEDQEIDIVYLGLSYNF